MPENEQKRPVIIPLIIGIAIPLAAIILMTAFAGYQVLVKDTAGNFYRARALFISGNAFICVRNRSNYPARKQAYENKEPLTTLSVISMKRVAAIEVVPEQEEETGLALPGWQPTLKDFVGNYTVNAANNHGFLVLRAANGALYGTIRFPDWGRGATEYLKNVRIAGNKIYFTRSVTTQQEIKRLGASGYFVQQYSGEYFKSGNTIRGIYTVYGAKKPWEAVKTR